MAAPPTVEQGGLIDGFIAAPERRHDLIGGLAQGNPVARAPSNPLQLNDLPTFFAEVREETPLMIDAPPRHEIEGRVFPEWAFDEIGCRGELEMGEVSAGEKAHEIRRAIDRSPIDQLHGSALGLNKVRPRDRSQAKDGKNGAVLYRWSGLTATSIEHAPL